MAFCDRLRSFIKTKYGALLIAVLLCIIAGTSYLSAKYVHSSNAIVNDLVPGNYKTLTIHDIVSRDTDNYYYKSSLTISSDNSAYPVYVRVALIATWQDANGNVYGEQPYLNDDYTVEYNSEHWSYNQNDGYYYYTSILQPGETSEPLIKSDQKLKQISGSPAQGYTMHVEVIAESIQAAGTTDSGNVAAVTDAWGYRP